MTILRVVERDGETWFLLDRVESGWMAQDLEQGSLYGTLSPPPGCESAYRVIGMVAEALTDVWPDSVFSPPGPLRRSDIAPGTATVVHGGFYREFATFQAQLDGFDPRACTDFEPEPYLEVAAAVEEIPPPPAPEVSDPPAPEARPPAPGSGTSAPTPPLSKGGEGATTVKAPGAAGATTTTGGSRNGLLFAGVAGALLLGGILYLRSRR